MDLKLAAHDGDIDISSGDLVLLDGENAVAQHLRVRLRFFLGEWFLDTRLGIPYFQKLLGHRPNTAAVRAIFRRAILATPGVRELNGLVVDYDGGDRKITISFTALVTGGDAPINFSEDIFV